MADCLMAELPDGYGIRNSGFLQKKDQSEIGEAITIKQFNHSAIKSGIELAFHGICVDLLVLIQFALALF
jgi:hypothetical protein